MRHVPEHQPALDTAKAEQKQRDLAACYVRVFSTDDGKRVLAHLMELFPPEQARFVGSNPCVHHAAVRDGQSFVTKTIRDALEKGAPLQLPNPNK